MKTFFNIIWHLVKLQAKV